MINNKTEINFLDSFKADTLVVREVIDVLMRDLRSIDYPKDEVDEIILSMDEAITNAVQETLFTQQQSVEFVEQCREITVRYHITDDEFDSTVIDHGKGLDIERMLKVTPDKNSDDYKDQIFDYVKQAEKKRLHVRLNGNEISLNGIGAGLRIMLSFMDNITIDLIDKKKILTTCVSESTEGTILNMQRKRRY